jgi:hypothetical protein
MPASGVLFCLKRKNDIRGLRYQEEKWRAVAASWILADRWEALGGDAICSRCDPDVYKDKRRALLGNMIEHIETSQEPCGMKDMETAIKRWLPEHLVPSEKRRSYVTKVTFRTNGIAGVLMTVLLLYGRYYQQGNI